MALNLFNTERLDGSHWAVALRTLSGRRLVCCGRSFRRLLNQNTAELKQCSTFSVRQPSEVANTGKTLGQHMLQEPRRNSAPVRVMVRFLLLLTFDTNVMDIGVDDRQ